MKKQSFCKKAVLFGLAGILLVGNTIPAFAGQWITNENGRWWQRDDGSYPVSTWLWIDEDLDGIAERYYFGEDGYLRTNMEAPDGNPAVRVNENGAWNEAGIVQVLRTEALGEKGHQQEAVVPAAGAVTDGKSWPQITFDETLYRAASIRNGLDLLPERTQTEPAYLGQDEFGPVYSMQWKGKTITIGTDIESNCAGDYFGPVSAFFNNFPEQGMELNAFYDNTGYESLAWGRHVVASSGQLDSVFRLPMASYRVGDGDISREGFSDGDWLPNMVEFSILLAPGDHQTWDINENWYIFPDSLIWIH